jgi:hypothetical protein
VESIKWGLLDNPWKVWKWEAKSAKCLKVFRNKC